MVKQLRMLELGAKMVMSDADAETVGIQERAVEVRSGVGGNGTTRCGLLSVSVFGGRELSRATETGAMTSTSFFLLSCVLQRPGEASVEQVLTKRTPLRDEFLTPWT